MASTPFTRVACFLTLSLHANAFIVGCGSRLYDQRIDAIVNPGTPSGHVHTVMGGNGMNFTMSATLANDATCSTCEIQQDLSNYWTPKMYYYNMTTGQFVAVPQSGDGSPEGKSNLSGQKAYYLQRRGSNNDALLTAFPTGFRMLAGDPFKRNYTGDFAAKAISFSCLGSNQPETNYLPPYNCPGGMRAQVFFPQCWDGKNLDTPDHKSHVAYPNPNDPRGADYNGGYCSDPNFPVHFPSLFYEVFYDTQTFAAFFNSPSFNGTNQPFVFAQGDPTGYGFHGDFVNGWNVTALQQSIDINTGCDGGGADASTCQYFTTFSGDQMNGCKIPPQINEDVYGPFSQLPGCNPIQYGPGYATNYGKGCSRAGSIGPYKTYYTDFTSSGWSYVGCIPDNGNDRTFNTPLAYNFTETLDMCFGYCQNSGFKYAGAEYGAQCYCSNTLRADRPPVQSQGQCNVPCPGNATQICGGSNALSAYQKCTPGSPCINPVYQHVT